MFRTLLTASAIAGVLTLGIPTGAAALTNGAQNPVKKVGKATKEAGKATAKGTKEAVKTTGEVTSDAAKKTATETKNAGKTVEGAARPDAVSARCKDGKVHTGKTKAEACAGHGGIKK